MNEQKLSSDLCEFTCGLTNMTSVICTGHTVS